MRKSNKVAPTEPSHRRKSHDELDHDHHEHHTHSVDRHTSTNEGVWSNSDGSRVVRWLLVLIGYRPRHACWGEWPHDLNLRRGDKHKLRWCDADAPEGHENDAHGGHGHGHHGPADTWWSVPFYSMPRMRHLWGDPQDAMHAGAQEVINNRARDRSPRRASKLYSNPSLPSAPPVDDVLVLYTAPVYATSSSSTSSSSASPTASASSSRRPSTLACPVTPMSSATAWRQDPPPDPRRDLPPPQAPTTARAQAPPPPRAPRAVAWEVGRSIPSAWGCRSGFCMLWRLTCACTCFG